MCEEIRKHEDFKKFFKRFWIKEDDGGYKYGIRHMEENFEIVVHNEQIWYKKERVMVSECLSSEAKALACKLCDKHDVSYIARFTD